MSRARWLRLRPAGSPEAAFSARSCPRLPPKLRPASANQSLGPHWPATSGLFLAKVLRGTPHALTVLVRDDGEPMEQCAEGGRGALERYRQISAGLAGTGEPGTSGMEGVAVLRNSLPVWNEGMGAFTLPFYSRAQLPSKKNFHIVRPESPDDILLLFGKHSKAGNLTSFSLDFCRPLSVLAAFGIALTAFGGSD